MDEEAQVEAPEPVPVKALFRMYPDTEVIALLPYMSGDPTGKWCVAFMRAAQYMSVDPDMVIANTEPAPKPKYSRILKLLEAEPEPTTVTVLKKYPNDAAEYRQAHADDYKTFQRVHSVNAHR